MYIILAFGGIAILIPLLIWHQSIHNIIISIYEKRPFSITERLLTQPRIIFFICRCFFIRLTTGFLFITISRYPKALLIHGLP